MESLASVEFLNKMLKSFEHSGAFSISSSSGVPSTVTLDKEMPCWFLCPKFGIQMGDFTSPKAPVVDWE